MKPRLLLFAWLVLAFTWTSPAAPADAPLRIFLRGGPKTHGPAGNGLHEHERWLQEWQPLLASRGAQVQGGMRFPSAEQLAETDVLVMFAAEAASIEGAQREALERFLKRGGGLVCIHDAVCGNDPQWFKTIAGGAWEHGHSKWFEGEVSLYYVNKRHPITESASNFDVDDEVYWDLHLMPETQVLAASWEPDARNTRGGRPHPHIYGVIPQMWAYENQLEGGEPYRAFVSLPGHQYDTFELPNYRAVLLRGIAWAGKREVDSLCTQEELASLLYPEGGPTAPEKADEQLEVHPEFDMNLVATEPLINKPISMDWDAAGRLWVAETPEYPGGRRAIRPEDWPVAWKDRASIIADPDREALDRISILTDSNGDGRMDRKTIFFEGLELVTGFVFHQDGVIVAQAPDILWLRDTDGDGRADRTEKLYTGLGTADTHAVINNLRRGFDGWIYATHGYSAGDVRSGDGSRAFGRIGSGVVRFLPDGTAFEQYSSKGGNTWGLDVAWDNEVFFTQPTSGDLLNHVVVPEHVLARGKTANTASYRPVIRGRRSNPLIQSEHLAYVQIDVVGGFTAAAGCAIYDGGAWPAEWRNSYFTTEPTINIVHHEVVESEGVTYTARKTRDAEFIGGRDLWYRPIETRVGPDGALYIIDFYNQAVIHNDTRGPRHNAVNAAVRPDRDHYFGRIWRVHHKQARTLEVPDLSGASMADLTGALNHPNQHVRMNAQRLLIERGAGDEFRGVEVLLADASQPPSARIHALWVLARAGTLSSDQLAAAARDEKPAVRKNAMQVAALAGVDANDPETRRAVLEGLDDDSPQVRLQALTTLGQFPADETAARRVVSVYPTLEDSWSRSVVVGLAARAPVLHARMVLESDVDSDADASRAMDRLAADLGRLVGERADADSVRQLILLTAGAPATKGTVKVELLRELTARLRDDFRLSWDEELETAMGGLLRSEDEAVAMVALPLIARWDQDGSLRSDVEELAGKLLPRLSVEGVPDGERTLIARTLLGVRQMDDRILPATAEFLLAEGVSRDARGEVIEFMGTLQEQAVGGLLIEVFSRLPLQLQDAAFAQLVKRPEWTLALVNALEKGDVTLATLGPGNVFRLRAHSDPAVARRAGSVIDAIRGPEVREKEAVVAQLEPAVSRPGNAERGRELYTQNCAVCHKFEGEGLDVGPDLTGMAAHGVHELLVHIIDPNRFVEENFVSVSIETRDGEIYDGMVARENRNVVTLRNASGEIEVRTSEIRNRSRTGMSLMPEGFEALGEEGLRDLLSYMGAGESRYRILDLKPAFTANSLRGIYRSAEADNETLNFRQFGVVMVEDIPFEIVHPARTANGNNVTVLKGGEGLAKTFPQTVTIPEVGLKAARLHFLGGVGGWAYPCCGGNPNEGMPVARITVQYDDGESEEFILKNGVEFVDYNSQEDVPGSMKAPGLVRRGQVRWFTKTLRNPGVIREITLSSYDNIVAPTFVAITVESGDAEE